MKIRKLAIALLAVSTSLSAFAQSPLLQDGKEAMYQRVLTTPSCVLKKDRQDPGVKVASLSRFYVYNQDGDYLTVGPDTTGKIAGLLPKSCTVDWKIQTSVLFTNPANRNRALIFQDKSHLQAIVDDKDPKAKVAPLMENLKNNKPSDGVISAEPDKFVDGKSHFYLLPILNFETGMFDDGNELRELNIASVTKDGESQEANDANAIRTFNSAVVFVIDSSISMQKYIDRTKQTINDIVTKIKKAKLQDSVHFGLVAFRSNVQATPGLEYNTKIFVRPGEAKDVDTFQKKLAKLNQAKVSSKYFDEDSFSGVNTALKELDWSEYGGRYIILITDAGGINGSDKLSTTHLDAKELQAEAKQKGAAIFAIHLLTDAGKNNQEKAKAQYEELSYNDTVHKSLYYPSPTGSVDVFGKAIDKASNVLASTVRKASLGEEVPGTSGDDPAANSTNKKLAQDARKIGRAMQLAFLGKKLGTTAPDFLEGWMSDRDLVHHNKANCEAVVLLTKNELSNLKDITSKLIDSTNTGLIDSDGMFEQLKAIAVSMGSDPNSLNPKSGIKLNSGNIGEILDMLPYKSKVTSLTEDDWNSFGPDEQNRIIEELESKLKYYQDCNDDADKWVNLNDDGDSAESVYPIPLDLLP